MDLSFHLEFTQGHTECLSYQHSVPHNTVSDKRAYFKAEFLKMELQIWDCLALFHPEAVIGRMTF
jgi:hypothetical protein